MIGVLSSSWWNGPEQRQGRVSLLLCDFWTSETPTRVESAVFNPLPSPQQIWEVPAWAYLLRPNRNRLQIVLMDGPTVLGAGLHGESGLPVIGVRRRGPATPFSGLILRRGRPLYASTWGFPLSEAIAGVESMQGSRVPSLLARARRIAMGLRR